MSIENEAISPIELLSPVVPLVVRKQLEGFMELEQSIDAGDSERMFLYESVDILNKIFGKIPVNTKLLAKVSEQMNTLYKAFENDEVDVHDIETRQAVNQAIFLRGCFSAYKHEENEFIETNYKKYRMEVEQSKRILQ